MSLDKHPVHGILLLDKPFGLSANHALQRAKRIFQAEKAGHAGTLDPMATGMLPILFGEASKFAQSGLDANKCYEAVIKLGVATTTGDALGAVVRTQQVPDISSEQLKHLEQLFLGAQQQVPPMYSALKKEGVPLYRLARAGTVVERAPRSFFIYTLSLTQIDHDHLQLQVSCSKGTYIRTLAEDIAHSIDCAAHLIALRRTRVGDLSQPMHTLESLDTLAKQNNLLQTLLPIDSFLTALPLLSLSKENCQALFQGKKIYYATHDFSVDQSIRLYTEQGCFCGVGGMDTEGYLYSKRLLNTTDVIF